MGVTALLALTMPTSYIVEGTGPALEVNPLVKISGVRTYPKNTDYFLTTVSAWGNPDGGVPGLQAWRAIFTSDELIPIRAIYPKNLSAKELNYSNAVMMTNSQDSASIIAAEAAGLPISMKLRVTEVDNAGASDIHEGDIIKALIVNGTRHEATSLWAVNRVLSTVAPETKIQVVVDRDGHDLTVPVTTIRRQPGIDGIIPNGSLLGLLLHLDDVTTPLKVTYGIEGIGGPSAGQMFALDIYDSLTDGSLGGKHRIAGTGTINLNGTIGPIGGITHKLIGAAHAGAQYFIAPAENCSEVVGHVPDGMKVFAVRTFDDSLAIVRAIGDGADLSTLPTCK